MNLNLNSLIKTVLAILFFLCLVNMPYGFYQFVRFVGLIGFAILAYQDNIGKKVRMLGRLVTIKWVPTVRKEIMNFGTFLDVTGEFFDTVHFPPSLKSYPFRGDGIYLVLGKIVQEFGFPSIEVEKMAKMPFKPNPQA